MCIRGVHNATDIALKELRLGEIDGERCDTDIFPVRQWAGARRILEDDEVAPTDEACSVRVAHLSTFRVMDSACSAATLEAVSWTEYRR